MIQFEDSTTGTGQGGKLVSTDGFNSLSSLELTDRILHHLYRDIKKALTDKDADLNDPHVEVTATFKSDGWTLKALQVARGILKSRMITQDREGIEKVREQNQYVRRMN
mgnify:CR=1 FL=1